MPCAAEHINTITMFTHTHEKRQRLTSMRMFKVSIQKKYVWQRWREQLLWVCCVVVVHTRSSLHFVDFLLTTRTPATQVLTIPVGESLRAVRTTAGPPDRAGGCAPLTQRKTHTNMSLLDVCCTNRFTRRQTRALHPDFTPSSPKTNTAAAGASSVLCVGHVKPVHVCVYIHETCTLSARSKSTGSKCHCQRGSICTTIWKLAFSN